MSGQQPPWQQLVDEIRGEVLARVRAHVEFEIALGSAPQTLDDAFVMGARLSWIHLLSVLDERDAFRDWSDLR